MAEPHIHGSDLARNAALALANRPLRSALTASGIAFGIAAAVATLILTLSASNSVTAQFDALSAVQVRVQFPDAHPFLRPHPKGDTARALLMIDGVDQAGFLAVAVSQPVVTTYPSANEGIPGAVISLIAAQPEIPKAIGATLLAGRWADEGMERRGDRTAIIDAATARLLGWTPASACGRLLYINSAPHVVMGVYQAPVSAARFTSAILVGYHEAVTDRSTSFLPTEAVIKVRLGAAEVVGQQAALALAPEAPSAPLVSVPPQLQELRQNVSAQTVSLFYGLAAITGLVGCLGVSTTMLTSVVERRREIGLRRAVGARRRDVVSQILLESAGLGVFGGVLGTLVGFAAAVVVCLTRGWLIVAEPWIWLAPVIGTVVGLLAGSIPAVAAAKVEPADALRAAE